MSWFEAAILSPAVLGATSIIESHILSRRVKSLQVYMLVAVTFHLIWASLLFYLFPFPYGISVWALLIALATGIFRTTGVTFMLYAMRREEVSRIIPVVFTYPVFVALIAVPLLGETLSYLQWLAILIVVFGAIMVSIKKHPSGSTIWPGKMFLLLFGVSFLFAMADITGKYSLAYFSPWNILVFNESCFGFIWLAISMRPRVFREMYNIRREHSTTAVISIAQILAPIGVVLLLWAMERGPVSLISTISGSRPVFVAIGAFILSRLSPKFIMQPAGKGTMALRLAATALIVVGISIIYLT